jgi:hypothetical protein
MPQNIDWSWPGVEGCWCHCSTLVFRLLHHATKGRVEVGGVNVLKVRLRSHKFHLHGSVLLVDIDCLAHR